MKLLICNFEIMHRSDKTNLINILSRQSNYKDENIFANHLLLTLQQKLTRIESLKNFIFIAIKELYCLQVKNNVEKMFIHDISMNKYSTKFVKNMLQNEIYCAWVKSNVKKTFIYNDNEERYSAELVEDMLQDEVYHT